MQIKELSINTLDHLARKWQKYSKKKDIKLEFICYHFRAIGHFTLMVGDKLSHIGCAMVQYDQPLNGYTYKVFIFTCNYSLNNIYYQPIYLRGAVGSKCTTGNHTKYRGLCSDDENIISDIY